MDTPEISVVVLAYRSAATITNVVDSLIDSLEKENLLWKIVLVENYCGGVGDQTPDVVRGIAARDSRPSFVKPLSILEFLGNLFWYRVKEFFAKK